MDYEYTRQKISALFDQTGMSQKDFAEVCDLNQSTVTRLLTGKRSPQLETLVKLCRTFKIPPAYFVRELRDSGGDSVTDHAAPLTSERSLFTAILVELQSVDSPDVLFEILEFIRFRKSRGKYGAI